VQTLKGDRLDDFKARYARPALIVVDEAHHAVAPSYRKILDAFPDAKVLGLTATPDRADERAMGQVFDSVAFVYEILDAITDGYLCPVVRLRVLVDAIDLSASPPWRATSTRASSTASCRLRRSCTASPSRCSSEAGDRRTIVFSTSVENAHRMAEIINRYRPEAARAVDGGTNLRRAPAHPRRPQGRALSVPVQRRRAHRGLRRSGRVVRGDRAAHEVALALRADGRAAACASSPGKKDCLLLDFVGKNGAHKLATALDILGGKYDDEVIAKAKEIADRDDAGAMPTQQALEIAVREIEAAKAREAAKRARIKAKVNYRTEAVDPFAILHVRHDEDPNAARFGMTATEKQLETLTRAGVEVQDGMSRMAASKLIGSIFKRRELHLASFRQLKMLRRYGVTDVNLGFTRASDMIEAIKRNGWKLPANLNAQPAREPGAGDDELY
jgi:hypothetical protein